MTKTKKPKITPKGHQGTKYYTGAFPVSAPTAVLLLFLIIVGADRISCWTAEPSTDGICGISYGWLMLFPLFVFAFLVALSYELVKAANRSKRPKR